ncbi:MAG: hypothetical protein NPIRA01_02670 [Nitrospirales bacterium]|nr:MAG: hypothetical protein NPIRA01_02670 [Nitrospirales bacterium]
MWLECGAYVGRKGKAGSEEQADTAAEHESDPSPSMSVSVQMYSEKMFEYAHVWHMSIRNNHEESL